MKKNRILFILGGIISVIGFLMFVKSMGTMAVMSSWDFGQFWASQPAVLQSILLWSLVAVVGSIMLYRGSGGEKKL